MAAVTVTPRATDAVRRFAELSRADVAFAGGKGANLGELTAAGVPVPPGFVVGAPAYAAYCDEGGLREQLTRALDGVDVEDTAALEAAADQARGRDRAGRDARLAARGDRRGLPRAGRRGRRPARRRALVGHRGGHGVGLVRRHERDVPQRARRARGGGGGAPLLGVAVRQPHRLLPRLARASTRRAWTSPSSCSARSPRRAPASCSRSTRPRAAPTGSSSRAPSAWARASCPAASRPTATSSTRTAWRSSPARCAARSWPSSRCPTAARALAPCTATRRVDRCSPTTRCARWPSWPCASSTTTTAPRTPSGPSTPTARCGCCSRGRSPRPAATRSPPRPRRRRARCSCAAWAPRRAAPAGACARSPSWPTPARWRPATCS